ncbi:MAG TPA: hypothetical protein VHO47_04215 [Candidatus Babeliales bacterium]|nr:hypothetical protein [Candidatus Babeliales bacterium]
MIRPSSKALFGLALSFILLQIVSLFKVNAILGSQCAFFSLSNSVLPLIGVWCGLPLAIGGLVLRGLLKGLLFTDTIFTPLAYHIPTICASAYWSAENRAIKILIPLICIALFLAHPVGAQAWWYSCYWFIPMVIQLIPVRSLFLTAFGTTFTAHAVGSVLWIYCLSMTVPMFAALMPIVIIERLIYASGMVLIYYCGNWFGEKLIKIKSFAIGLKGSMA